MTTNDLQAREAINQVTRQLEDAQSLKQGNRSKADFKPEIYFIGQIVGGTDFPVGDDGLLVEASLKYGQEW